MPDTINILIADDHPIFRKGLIATIERIPYLRVVAEAENGVAALELIGSVDPDITILDIDMPEMDGVETARELKSRSARTRPIFLTMHKDSLILRSLKSLGVKGYVLKDSALNEIVKCVDTVVAGNIYISPALTELMLDDTDDGTFRSIDVLTIAERKVLSLITESKTNREIADELFVSVRTVETHRYNICSKLGLNGAHALFKFAIQNKKKILASVRN